MVGQWTKDPDSRTVWVMTYIVGPGQIVDGNEQQRRVYLSPSLIYPSPYSCP